MGIYLVLFFLPGFGSAFPEEDLGGSGSATLLNHSSAPFSITRLVREMSLRVYRDHHTQRHTRDKTKQNQTNLAKPNQTKPTITKSI